MSTVRPAACMIDDDDDLRAAFKVLMKSVAVPQVSFGSAEEFFENYGERNLGCLVVDLRLPGQNGIEFLRKLRDDNILIPAILLTGHADVPLAVQAVKLGAIDVIAKPFKDEVLVERVKEGISRWEAFKRFQTERSNVSPRFAALTPREIQVLDLMVSGHKNRKIAETLGISTKTLDIHRANILRKMQTKTIADLVRWRLINKAEPTGVMPMTY